MGKNLNSVTIEKSKEIKVYLKLQRKLFVLEYAKRSHSVAKALKEFKIPKATYYEWKKIYDKDGKTGYLKSILLVTITLIKSKRRQLKKSFFLRKEYQLGSWRIKWYLERYHGITISESSVSRILKRYGVERLQKKASLRALLSKRYNKSVLGHHVQMDVKVLLLKDLAENSFKRF